MRAFLSLALVLTVACSTEPDPVGRDTGNNNDDRDTERDDDRDTARDDDPDTTPPDEPECTRHSDCGSFDLCVREECEDALDRRYRFLIVSIDAATTDPDGNSWDIGGGAPDFVLDWGSSDEGANTWIDACSFTAAANDFSPSVNSSCEVIFESGESFRVNLYESDVSSDDFVAAWLWEGNDELTTLARRSGAGTRSMTAGNLSITYQVTALF